MQDEFTFRRSLYWQFIAALMALAITLQGTAAPLKLAIVNTLGERMPCRVLV